MGYANIAKGIRRLDDVLSLAMDPPESILEALSISTEEFREAVEKDRAAWQAIRQRQAEQREFFRLHFHLVLENAQKILDSPRYCNVVLLESYVAAPYAAGSGPIPIGVLLEMWMDRKLIVPCPQCNGRAYILGGGSGCLGGARICHGLCIDCSRFVKGINPDNHSEDFVRPVMTRIHSRNARFKREPAISWWQLLNELKEGKVDEDAELSAPEEMVIGIGI